MKGPTKNQTSSPSGWLCMRIWRMSLRRMKSTIISGAGSDILYIERNTDFMMFLLSDFSKTYLSFSGTYLSFFQNLFFFFRNLFVKINFMFCCADTHLSLNAVLIFAFQMILLSFQSWNEPHQGKTCLRGLWHCKTQTGLLFFRS